MTRDKFDILTDESNMDYNNISMSRSTGIIIIVYTGLKKIVLTIIVSTS